MVIDGESCVRTMSLLMLLLFILFVLIVSMSFFIPSRNRLGSILNSQTDPPTLRNDGFTGEYQHFQEKSLRSKDGLGNVLGLSRGHFGSSGASIGGSLRLPNRPKKVSRSILELSWASFARFLLSKMVSGPFSLLSELRGVDFELPSWPSDSQK